MKRTVKSLVFSLLALVLGFVAFNPLARAAGTATLSLSPASSSLEKGSALSVDIYEDSGSDEVNAVVANLTYDQGILQFGSISNSSVYNIDAQTSGGNGHINLQRGSCVVSNGQCTHISGKQLVATIHFTTIAAGTAAVTFDNTSAVYKTVDSSPEQLTFQNGSYTVTEPAPVTPPPSPNPTPAPTPSPTPSGSSSSSTNKKTTTTQTPTQTTTPSTTSTPTPTATAAPTVSNVKVTNLTSKTATVTWTTDTDSTSEVHYGLLEGKYIISDVDKKLTKNHSVVLASHQLVPGQTYHFIVTSIDASGRSTSSKDATFTVPREQAVVQQKKNNFWLAFVITVAIGAAAVAAAYVIRRMHNNSGGGGNGTPPPSTPDITPGAGDGPVTPPPTGVIAPTAPQLPKVETPAPADIPSPLVGKVIQPPTQPPAPKL